MLDLKKKKTHNDGVTQWVTGSPENMFEGGLADVPNLNVAYPCSPSAA